LQIKDCVIELIIFEPFEGKAKGILRTSKDPKGEEFKSCHVIF